MNHGHTGRPIEVKSLTVDLYGNKLLNNPYPVYLQIRDLGSAVWLPKRRLWTIGRFEDVRFALRSDAAAPSVLRSRRTGYSHSSKHLRDRLDGIRLT
jgi:cytochrome P450